jgi:hypothetical protein
VNWTPHASIAAHTIIYDDAASQPLSIAQRTDAKPICLCGRESKSFNSEIREKNATLLCAPPSVSSVLRIPLSELAEPKIGSFLSRGMEGLLFLRPVWCAHVLVTQIPQHLPVVFAHPAREVRII